MFDGDDFRLDDVPAPGSGARSKTRAETQPEPEDAPPGTRDVVLPSYSSYSSEMDRFSLDGGSFAPVVDELAKSSTAVSGKPSVLGTELAKKRLQAFCIQKKQLNAPGCTSSKNAGSPTVIGNISQGSLKKVSNVSKTNRLGEYAEKLKNIPSKKPTKKVMNGYERSRTTLTEILELKKEEERKLALVKLGIPLGLVPGGAHVKGLTTKPMPTKAMPPIKNFLDPHEVELLLDKAASMTDKLEIATELSSKTDGKSVKKSSSHYSRSYNDRKSHKDRYFDNYKNRDYRNDNYRSKRRDESHSRHSHRDSSKYYSKSENSSSNKIVIEDKQDVAKVDNKKVDNLKKRPCENIFDLDELSAIVQTSNKDVFQLDSVHQLSQNETDTRKIFEVSIPDHANKSEDRETNITTENIDGETKLENTASETNAEIQFYNKFLKEKFIPVLELDETSKSAKENSFVLNKDVQNPNITLLNKNENPVLYSPGMESSTEATPFSSPLCNKSINVTCNPVRNGDNKNDEKITNDCWNEIEQVYYPKTHLSSKCYKKTAYLPSLIYCENSDLCDCANIRNKNYEKLLSNIDRIIDQLSIDHKFSYNPDTVRQWYPKACNALQNSVLPEILSNWETDDSLSQLSFSSLKHQSNNSTRLASEDLSKESNLNFKDLNISTNVKSVVSDFEPVIKYQKNNSPLTVSNLKTSLDSEYEKFLEAVCSKTDESNTIEKSPEVKETKISANIANKDFISKELSLTNEITEQLLNKNVDFSNNLDSVEFSIGIANHLNPSKINDNSICNTESKNIISDCFSMDVNLNESKISVPQNESKTDECWSSDNLSDIHKNDHFFKFNYMSPKPKEKRKGHAKISSRRHKGKHKNSKMKKLSKSSSSSSSSSTSETSNSDHSTSTSSESSDDSSSSSDDSSTSSSSSTSTDSSSISSSSSGSESSSSTDLSYSSSNSDEKRSKSKKKKHFSKKKYRKLSKSKRKHKKIIAKAKELARKIRQKKRKKKMKEKLLIQEKNNVDTDIFLYAKETTDDFNLKNNSHDLKIEESIDNIIEHAKNKRKNKDKTINPDHKKRKRISVDSSSSSSNSSSDSIPSIESESRKRLRSLTNDDQENIIQSKKSKNTLNFDEDTANTFNVDTLINIKRESESDDENSKIVTKINEYPYKLNRNNFRHEIISASELQNDFLQCNQNDDFSNSAKIKIETTSTYNEELVNNTSLECKDLEKVQNIKNDDTYQNTSIQKSLDLKNEDSTMALPLEDVINSNSSVNRIIMQPNSEIKAEINVGPIERIESVKIHRERKPSRWESNSRLTTSTLIEVPIQTNIDSTILNTYVDNKPESNILNNENLLVNNVEIDKSKTECKVYKIQTISSRNILPNIQNYEMNVENYENYDVFDKQNLTSDEFPIVNSIEFTESREPLKKISLDDRINVVLQYSKGEDINESLLIEKPPEKGILVIGGARLTRADPRITKGKKVSFADGFVPGQDSDCENETENLVMKNLSSNGTNKKKKKRKSCGGHAYPCPSTWPDYHPRWDKLPPPGPPPGSPPPELCEKNFSVLNSNNSSNPLSRITRMPNTVAS